MTKKRRYELFTCPNCGNRATQSIELAYSRSVRIGTSGHESVSAFGKSIAPPPEKDESFVPFLAVCGATIAGMIWLPDLLPRLGFSSFVGLSAFSRPVLLVSGAVGLLVGSVLAARAINFNVLVRSRLLEEWARGSICNRCGHRFNRLPTERGASKESPYGG